MSDCLLLICHVSDLEWKLIYVGSAEDEKCDQELESVLVGPVNCGTFRFVFQVKITVGVHMTHVTNTVLLRVCQIAESSSEEVEVGHLQFRNYGSHG